jgi:hypothetical protein
MLSASGEMNKIELTQSMDIGGISGTENDTAREGLQHGAELAETLRLLCCRGAWLTVQGPQRLSWGVTIDLSVTGPTGTFGIVCDTMDAARIRSRPEALLEANLDRVYCVSGLDSLLNPEGVARSLSTFEPGYFQRSRVRAAGPFTPIEMIRADTPVIAHELEVSETPGIEGSVRAA